MKLYLAQHGKAIEKSIDPLRPLSDQGRIEVNGVARYLQQAGVNPTNIYHSGKPRAEQTANIFASVLNAEGCAALDGINPNDNVGPIAPIIERWEEDSMIVGHFPFLPHLTQFLLTSGGPTDTDYLPGNIVCLEKDSDNAWILAGSCNYANFS